MYVSDTTVAYREISMKYEPGRETLREIKMRDEGVSHQSKTVMVEKGWMLDLSSSVGIGRQTYSERTPPYHRYVHQSRLRTYTLKHSR